MPAPYSKELRERVAKALGEGATQVAVAKRFDVAERTTHAEQFDARLQDLPVPARALLSPAQDRALVTEAHGRRLFHLR